ncbi:MAG: metal ABC transporter permease [Synechococcales cyanobacterium]
MSDFWSVLMQPFAYEFFVRALIVGVLSGSLCGVMGVYIIIRRMSYIAHGLSHAILGGAVLSYLLNINFYIGAGIWGFLSAIGIQYLTSYRIYADAAIGIITTASFAMGIALISTVRRFNQNFEAALFGNVLGITPTDVWVILSVSIVLIGIIVWLYQPLLFWCFDREVAQVHGVPVRLMDMLFALMLATLLVTTLQVLGVTLIISAVIIPAATARLLTHHFTHLLVISGFIGAGVSFAGLYLSYYLDIASGASVVLLSTFVFGLVFMGSLLFQKKRGIVTKPDQIF